MRFGASSRRAEAASPIRHKSSQVVQHEQFAARERGRRRAALRPLRADEFREYRCVPTMRLCRQRLLRPGKRGVKAHPWRRR